MAGIERVVISRGRGSDKYEKKEAKFREAKPLINEIYRAHFRLQDGEREIHVPIYDDLARKDYEQGLDIYLRLTTGATQTVQEKILDYWEDTFTVEYTKGSGKPGTHYYCIAGYYMVAYYRAGRIDSYALIDWNRFKNLDAEGLIPWAKSRIEVSEGNTFNYVYFQDIPESCVVGMELPEEDYPF